MAFSGLIDSLRERWRPLKAKLFPQQILLEFSDDRVSGQILRDGKPAPLSLEAPLPSMTVRNGMPLEKEPLGDLIGDLLVNEGVIDACVLAALPPTAAEWRVVVWPLDEVPDDFVAALRQVNPPLRLSTSLQDCSIDLLPLPGRPSQMLLGASSKALVDEWIDVFNIAGVQLERLAPAQSCQLVALTPLLGKAPPHQLIALLDPQPSHCRLQLFRSGIPVFEWNLASETEKLVSELMRCLSFYKRQDPEVREWRVVLAQTMNAQSTIEDMLGLKAEVLDAEPFASLVLQGLAAREWTP